MSTHPASAAPRRVTAADFARAKAAGRKLVMCTAYDYHSARLVDAAGIDAILIGDSAGMTMLGYDSTVPVTMDDMVFFTKAVSHAAQHALVVADMPFMSYHASVAQGVKNAARLVREGGAQAIKLEGATPQTLEIIGRLTTGGIPVVAHLGLTPQSINTLGGYRTQARESDAALQLIASAHAVQEAGAFALTLECIPAELAALLTETLALSTIGIGAGLACDAEVQVYHDLLGYGSFKPRHAKHYAQAEEIFSEALAHYASDVRERAFPTEEQTVHLAPEVIEEIKHARF